MLRVTLTRGALCRRIGDPVHTGRITRISHTDAGTLANVLWLSNKPPLIERRIPVAELEPAEDWKKK